MHNLDAHVWVGLHRDCIPVNSLSLWRGNGGGTETGVLLSRLFDRFLNNFITNKFQVVPGRMICWFGMDENPKTKRRGVYDLIRFLRVKSLFVK